MNPGVDGVRPEPGPREGDPREDDEARQRGKHEPRAPSGLPVPRPPGGGREEQRERRRGEREREPRVAPADQEEARDRENADRRVPEEALVGQKRQPQQAREERVRERLAAVAATQLAATGPFEEKPEKENSCE